MFEKRHDIISEIEKARESKVIVYITGDRNNFNTKIGDDVIPLFYDILEKSGTSPNIDLLIYTRGGDMVVPIRIVKLFRNYCSKFSVIIPYRCHSAGTLIALGADEIIMTKLAELTPVDPTAEGHPFNPFDNEKKKHYPVSVEDVRSFILFAKDELKAGNKDLVDLYAGLTNHKYESARHLHPLALGNVYRAQRMIRLLVKRLLLLHNNHKNIHSKRKINKIINEITRDICIHNYPIYRDEAGQLGLNIIIPQENLEEKIWNLYELYSDEMLLMIPFDPLSELGSESRKELKYCSAYIETTDFQYTFNYDIAIERIAMTPSPGQPVMPGINTNIRSAKWEKVK